jgi:hypothetical protein
MMASSKASAKTEFVCFDNGVLLGSGARIADSMATTAGGAISASLCDVSLQGADVLNNGAVVDAGGVHLGMGASLVVQGGVIFRNNSAQSGSGGALMCESCDTIDLRASQTRHNGEASNRFLDNRAKRGSGGAMRIKDPAHTITSSGSFFEGNVADQDGGAVFMSVSASAGTLSAWTSFQDFFSRNVAMHGSGGALAAQGTKVNLNHGTTCQNNTADNGGGGCLFWDALADDANSSRWESLKPLINFSDFIAAGNTALFQDNRSAMATPPRFFTLVNDAKRSWVMNAEDAGQNAGTFADESPTFVFQDSHLTFVRLHTTHSAGILLSSIPERMNAVYVGQDDGVSLYGRTRAERRLQKGDGKVFFNFGGDSPLRIKGPPSTGPHLVDVAASVAEPIKRTLRTNFGGSPGRNARLTMNIDRCANGVKTDAKCVPCPGKTILKIMSNGMNANKCICDPVTIIPNSFIVGYYNASAASASAKCDIGEKFCCAPCPSGADCTPLGYRTVRKMELQSSSLEKLSHDNADLPTHSLEIHELSPKPGYWRSNESLDIFASCADSLLGIDEMRASQICCPVPKNRTASVCKTAIQNRSHVCQTGYYGPLCRTCDRRNGYVKFGETCQICDALGGGPPSVVASFVSTLILSCLVYAGFVFLYIRLKLEDESTSERKKCSCFGKKDEKTEDERMKKAQRKNAANRLVGDQLLIGRLGGHSSRDQDAPSSSGAGLKGDDSNRSDFQIINDRIKVIWGWLQCFGALTTVFDSVPWPRGFRDLSMSMGSVFSFDYSSLVGITSCELIVPFLDNFLVHMFVPIFLIGAIVLARLPAHWLKRKTRQKQHELMMKSVTTLLLIMYPGLCSKIFSVVKCVEVKGGGGLRLAADLSVECFEPGGAHEKALAQFWIFLVLFVVGIPLGVAALLVKHKKFLFDKDAPRHKEIIHEFGSLYLQYEERYYLFEVTVIFKKMLLTGAISVVAPGSSVQVVVAIIVIMFDMLIVLKLAPFKDAADDFLSISTALQMMFTLLVAILLMTDIDSEYYDAAFMDTILIIVNSFSLVALLISIAIMHPKIRAKLNKFGSEGKPKLDGAAAELSSAKVVPAALETFPKASTKPHDLALEEANRLRSWGK